MIFFFDNFLKNSLLQLKKSRKDWFPVNDRMKGQESKLLSFDLALVVQIDTQGYFNVHLTLYDYMDFMNVGWTLKQRCVPAE